MVRKRILYLFGILIFISGLLPLGQVKAHNPSNMILGYDIVDDTLHVVISHSSEDFNTHYIFEIIVTRNGARVVNSSRTSQPSDEFTYMVGFAANNGDLIAVTARCTQNGTITRSITVGQQYKSLPGFVGLLFVIGVSTIIMIAVFYKNLSIRVVKWP